MNKEREITCIVCPNGCSLKILLDDVNILDISGALCKRGLEYARNEMTDPRRNLTTSVKVIDGELPLVSVRSDNTIPKEKLRDCVTLLRDITVKAPVALHQVIMKDILGTGVNIIATKEIKKINQ